MNARVDTLQGRTALVTGSARRIGRAVALALAQRGVNVIVHYYRSGQEAASLAEQIVSAGVKSWVVRADLSDSRQAERLFEAAVSKAGPIDILVNNASIFPEGDLWEVTPESIHGNMAIHAVAPLLLSRLFAGQKRPGHIVNLLDTRAVSYDKDHVAYHLGKRALLALTRMLAIELAPKIAVNAVAPGLILPPEGEDAGYLENLASTNPLNRYGCPQDVADAVIFLLSSTFITGQILYVDGGHHMKGRMYE